ncbi:hypothetical protein ILUMI_26070 [Ignelater luminosus]|uniref:Uncharacterized protein n=1 Tax=Ignelater luminosus TaxID=2038154 RepID=A0A8K0FZG0_IGNLU|nr:hypothetical protein ILUMI_26070 [Ignelater luminosus]
MRSSCIVKKRGKKSLAQRRRRNREAARRACQSDDYVAEDAHYRIEYQRLHPKKKRKVHQDPINTINLDYGPNSAKEGMPETEMYVKREEILAHLRNDNVQETFQETVGQHENLQEVAEKELNEDSKRLREDLEHIQEWIEKQPHLNTRRGYFCNFNCYADG